MATGRATQITRQIGEHLVVVELGRRGFVATPFAGNVPDFDILAADANGHALPIQVKAIRGPSWQFTATRFLEIELVDDTQHVRGRAAIAHPDLITVFVLIAPDEHSKDRYFIFELRDLQDHFLKSYGPEVRRPKNPSSLHCAVWPDELAEYEGNWALITERFATLSSPP
jgi:hypothetical protein